MVRGIIVAGFLLCVSVNARAASEDFSGLSFGADIGGQVDLSDIEAQYRYVNRDGAATPAVDVDSIRSGEEDVHFFSKVNTEYTHPVANKLLLGFETSFFFEDEKQTKSEPYIFGRSFAGGATDERPRNYRVHTTINPVTHLSFTLKPGCLLNENLLGFLTFSYHYMRANVVAQADADLTSAAQRMDLNDTSEKLDFNGVGVGGGLKYKLGGGWFLTASGEYILFEKERMAGPSFISTFHEISLAQTQEVEPEWVDARVGIGRKF